MDETIEPPIEEQPGEHLSWGKVWSSIILRPSTQTFEWILRDPQASTRRALVWVVVSMIIGAIISLVVNGAVNGVYSLLGIIPTKQIIQTMGISLILLPVGLIVSIFMLLLQVWLIQWIAGRFFNGSGTYASMIYAIAAFWAPTYLITSLISGIPGVNCLVIPLAIYMLVLGVTAVKAVNHISTGQAVITYFALPALFLTFACILTICVLTIFGPAISETFQNIIQGTGGFIP